MALCLSACGGGSYKSDLETICNAPQNAKVPAGADASTKTNMTADYIEKNLHSKEGKAFFTTLAGEPDKGKVLQDEATKNGIASCPMVADLATPTPTPTPPPPAKHVELSPSSVEAKAGIEAPIVDEVIARHLSELTACYEPALAKKPTLAGKSTLHFTIGTDGKVTKPSLKPSVDKTVDACVGKAAGTWVFPKMKKKTVVSAPVAFQP